MRNFVRIIATAGALAQAALGLSAFSASDALAQGAGAPVPPPLNFKRALYFKDHPTELAALVGKLSAPQDSVGPVADPPQTPGTVGGVWTSVTKPMPHSGASAPHLMMDGTVLVHALCTGNWYRLTPDVTGSYANGSWTALPVMPAGYNPLYFGVQVLVDGRLIMNGGEYNGNCTEVWTSLGAIYNPATNSWKSVASPFPPAQYGIGDAQSVVLFNKNYMLADCCTANEAILNPSTMLWTKTGTGKFDDNDEEAWSLLPKGGLLTGDAYVGAFGCGKGTQLYTAATGAWTNGPNSPVQLSDCTHSYEVGPQVLRPDGTAVMFSGDATGLSATNLAGTAIYNTTSGTLIKGANVPAVNGVAYTLADAPAALEPNGKILFAAAPGPAFSLPTHFFEYTELSATSNSAARLSNDPPNTASNPSYVYNLMVLPTGQILMTDGSNALRLYNPVGAGLVAWAPVITTLQSTTIKRGTTYSIVGKQLNGLSEAGAYGDDDQEATDFPLVRIRNNATGHVYYCKTTNESSRDIAVNAVSTMDFDCPAGVATGAATLVVVTNGIASTAKNVTIQ